MQQSWPDPHQPAEYLADPALDRGIQHVRNPPYQLAGSAAIAKAYAGHTGSGSDGARPRPTSAPPPTGGPALAALTGEPHPLATQEGGDLQGALTAGMNRPAPPRILGYGPPAPGQRTSRSDRPTVSSPGPSGPGRCWSRRPRGGRGSAGSASRRRPGSRLVSRCQASAVPAPGHVHHPARRRRAYAACALRAWLARALDQRPDPPVRQVVRDLLPHSMAGQVAYRPLAQAGAARAGPVTMIVSCLPVRVRAMGTALAHMLRTDAGTVADARTTDRSSGTPAWSAEAGRCSRPHPGPLAGSGPPAGTHGPAGPRASGSISSAASPGHAWPPAGLQQREGLSSKALRGNQGPNRPERLRTRSMPSGHSSCPGQTGNHRGANLIPRRRLRSCSPGWWRVQPDSAAGRDQLPGEISRVWSASAPGLGWASAVAGGLRTEDSRRIPRHRVQAIRTTASCCSAPRRHTADAAHRRESPVRRRS